MKENQLKQETDNEIEVAPNLSYSDTEGRGKSNMNMQHNEEGLSLTP